MDKAKFQSFKGSMFQSFPLMSGASRKSAIGMVVLVALGLLALYAGPKSLLILIPAAAFICYEMGPILRGDRN